MKIKLNKYSKNRPCPKCGDQNAVTFHRTTYKDPTDGKRILMSVMERVCKICGYRWYEFPLDF